MKTPKLVLKSAKSASVTYSFETEGDGFKSWALCTVNDQTGELLISSDWGSWSHRWHASPDALGASTLTAFIGGRADVDYLARKLQCEGRGGQVFSTKETARALRRVLCERRLNDGRCQLEGRLEDDDLVEGLVPSRLLHDYTLEGLPIFSGRTSDHDYMKRLPFLTAETARRIWNKISDLANELNRSNGDLFYERLASIDGFAEYVTGEPWEHGQTEQTVEDKVLRDTILPALIEACKTTPKSFDLWQSHLLLLVHGGEFATWIKQANPGMPFAALRELDEAEKFVAKYLETEHGWRTETSVLKTKDNVTDGDIRKLMRLATKRGHFDFAEVCVSALERKVISGNPSSDHSRVRCAEAINMGAYVDELTQDLPQDEQDRIMKLARGVVS